MGGFFGRGCEDLVRLQGEMGPMAHSGTSKLDTNYQSIGNWQYLSYILYIILYMIYGILNILY